MVLAISRPWRHPKTGTYWYRRRVPKELQLLLGRTEEKATLRTKEPAIARVRYLVKAMEVEKRWARLRAGEAALASAPVFGEFRFTHVRDERGAFDARPAADIPSSDPIAKEPILPIAMAGVAVPWRPVFEAYASEARLAPSTVKRWSGVMDTLENDLGTDDLAAVTPEFLLG
ncbi:MAG: DUF6538 domain-containing protein [Methylorubrum rhodinum]|uniref:DUF6538 domain-containing protein n=1 Tax=Methylorubrum rhodinum TaxID=29428 RepID=UPI003BAF8B0C